MPIHLFGHPSKATNNSHCRPFADQGRDYRSTAVKDRDYRSKTKKDKESIAAGMLPDGVPESLANLTTVLLTRSPNAIDVGQIRSVKKAAYTATLYTNERAVATSILDRMQ
eukprot:scaffold29369_cov36-Prasinocladus_malaysianus.AAC.1